MAYAFLIYISSIQSVTSFLMELIVFFSTAVKTYELRGKTKSELISTLDDLKRELSEV